ncbi:uncharacterized protein M6G45_014743 isoform 1-T1 [Spheniscus humboldti]
MGGRFLEAATLSGGKACCLCEEAAPFLGPICHVSVLLQNPQTRINVASGNEPAAFHGRPGGIRVLPTFEIKPPRGRTASDSSPAEGSGEKEGKDCLTTKPGLSRSAPPLAWAVTKRSSEELSSSTVAGSPPDKRLHRRKRRSPGNLTRAKEAKGEQGSTKRPVHNEEFNQLLSSLRAAFQSEQGADLGENMAEEQDKKGKAMDES